jgi:hypothetical protein
MPPLLALSSLQVGGGRQDGLVLMKIFPLGEEEDGVVLFLNLMNLNEGINNLFLVILGKDTGANNLKQELKNWKKFPKTNSWEIILVAAAAVAIIVNFGLNAGDWATNMTTTRMIVIK